MLATLELFSYKVGFFLMRPRFSRAFCIAIRAHRFLRCRTELKFHVEFAALLLSAMYA